MPVFFPVGIWDLILLAVGVALAVVAYQQVMRERILIHGPWCPRCDYSLEGNPAAATCPECGADFTQHPLIATGTRERVTLHWLAQAAIICIGVALMRLAPCWQSASVDFRMTAQSHGDVLDSPDWERMVFDVFAWQTGHQWVVLWGFEKVATFSRRLDPICLKVRHPGTGVYTKPMVVDPDTLSFRYPRAADGQLIHGQLLDGDAVVAWFADAGIDTTLPRNQAVANYVAMVIRGKAEGNRHYDTLGDPMSVSYHVSVGSRHPWHSLWTIGLMLVLMALAKRQSRRWIDQQLRCTAPNVIRRNG